MDESVVDCNTITCDIVEQGCSIDGWTEVVGDGGDSEGRTRINIVNLIKLKKIVRHMKKFKHHDSSD